MFVVVFELDRPQALTLPGLETLLVVAVFLHGKARAFQSQEGEAGRDGERDRVRERERKTERERE